MPAIVVQDLHKSYGSHVALRGIDFDVFFDAVLCEQADSREQDATIEKHVFFLSF